MVSIKDVHNMVSNEATNRLINSFYSLKNGNYDHERLSKPMADKLSKLIGRELWRRNVAF